MEGEGDYQAEVLGHLEGLMQDQNQSGEYYDPESEYDPAYEQAAEQQAIAADQETMAHEILSRHPVLIDSDASDRLLTEAQAQAQKLGVPELAGDLRFLGHVADQLGDEAFLSPFERIQAAGSEGLGRRVLDFKQD